MRDRECGGKSGETTSGLLIMVGASDREGMCCLYNYCNFFNVGWRWNFDQ